MVDRHTDIVTDMAIKGLLSQYLKPADWDALRLKLQNIYRSATGETMAVLTVDHTPDSPTPADNVAGTP